MTPSMEQLTSSVLDILPVEYIAKGGLKVWREGPR